MKDGKTIRFSHDPTNPEYKNSFLVDEWKYLKEKYDYISVRMDSYHFIPNLFANCRFESLFLFLFGNLNQKRTYLADC